MLCGSGSAPFRSDSVQYLIASLHIMRTRHHRPARITVFLTIICYPFYAPFLWLIRRYRRSSRYRAAQERSQVRSRVKKWKSDAVRPLPAVRARALTMPFLPLPGQQIKQQSQSALMGRLPSELRRMIYLEVLGGQVLHIVPMPKRLCYVRCCADPTEDSRAQQCWSTRPICVWCHDILAAPPPVERLQSLVMTCRQVYAHYQYPTHHFQDCKADIETDTQRRLI